MLTTIFIVLYGSPDYIKATSELTPANINATEETTVTCPAAPSESPPSSPPSPLPASPPAAAGPSALPLTVANLPPNGKFAKKTFSALKSCPRPLVPSHQPWPQSLPHTVSFSPPEHCAAAPRAEACKITVMRSCMLRTGAPAPIVLLVVALVLFETVAQFGVSGVRLRSWKRARARMARKASWSVWQVPRGAQATSVRWVNSERKVALMEAKEEM